MSDKKQKTKATNIYFLFGGEPFIIWTKNFPISYKFIDLINVKTMIFNPQFGKFLFLLMKN